MNQSFTFAVIIPTVGRATLVDTLNSILNQLLEGDQLLILRDGSDDYGMTARNIALDMVTADYLLWMDDDDVYVDGAFKVIREELAKNPNKPHIFKMQRGEPFNDMLPKNGILELGNVSTQMFVCPNNKAKLGRWGLRYEGDYDFISSTAEYYRSEEVIWIDKVIAVWRP